MVKLDNISGFWVLGIGFLILGIGYWNGNKRLVSSMQHLIKLLILFTILLFIYLKLREQDNLGKEVAYYILPALKQNTWVMVLVVVLMPLNWGLEAWKWRLLSRPIVRLSFFQAMKGVITGLTLSFITPHGLGDYVGRITQLSGRERLRLIGAVLLGRLCQMIATLFFGLLGVYYLTNIMEVITVGGAVVILGVLWGMRLRKKRIPFRKLQRYFKVMSTYTNQRVWQVLSLSALRYGVFCAQFVLVLSAFLPSLAWDMNISGVTWVFLAKSVIPAFNFLSDLGVREFSAIYFFERFGVEIVPVLSASLFIWLINILLPTLAGLPLLVKMKFRHS